jgi:hypothetical protein
MNNASPLEQVTDTSSVDTARASLVAQQQRLMDLLEERSKPTALDYWSTMAGALAGSGKSGYDALASAGAGSGLAVRQQDEKAITLAKMRADVANAMLGQAERQGLLRSVQGLFGGQGGGGSSVAPSISINAAQQSVFDSLPQRDKQVLLARISSGDPTEIHNVLKELSGEALKRSGPSDVMKTTNFYIASLPQEIQASARETASQIAVFGNPREYSEQLIKLGQAYTKGEITKADYDAQSAQMRSMMTPRATTAQPTVPSTTSMSKMAGSTAEVLQSLSRIEDPAMRMDALRAYMTQLESEGPVRFGQGVTPATPSNVMKPTESPSTDLPIATQRDIVAEGIKATQKADIDRRAKMEESWSTAAERSTTDRQNAKLTYDLVKANPSGFGLLNKPGWDKALAYLAEEGIRVGPYNISVADIQGAMRRAGGYTQADLDAVTKVQQLAIQTQLALASQAKGSVSNYEDRLFQAAGISINDSPKVIQYKTELVRARADMLQKTWTEWNKYKRTGGNIDDFRDSSMFKSLQSEYDKNLDSIFKAYK